MRAYINVWGKKYLVESISWFRNEGSKSISYISFEDEDRLTYVVHNKMMFDKENIEKMKGYQDGIIHGDLEKYITWEES
ncbi:hypothetical protein [Oceanobacillus locisalsi]|uniref:Uncharacterized protein n=1 Tax=Oceanobacillus locisalsi TaxID=546107 RepID=A0ABW3NJC3_9BACI